MVRHRFHIPDAGQDRIHPERDVQNVGDVGAKDDERRMRDIDDVEHAEGDRDSDCHGGIEPAQQQAGDQGVPQKIEW